MLGSEESKRGPKAEEKHVIVDGGTMVLGSQAGGLGYLGTITRAQNRTAKGSAL